MKIRHFYIALKVEEHMKCFTIENDNNGMNLLAKPIRIHQGQKPDYVLLKLVSPLSISTELYYQGIETISKYQNSKPRNQTHIN